MTYLASQQHQALLTLPSHRAHPSYEAKAQAPIMSLDPPTYLSSLQNNIRARPIPWEGAVRAGTITDSDLKTIKAVDKVRKEQRKQTVENDLDAYQSLILGGNKGKSVLDAAAKRSDVVQYMLVLADDLLHGKNSQGTAEYFADEKLRCSFSCSKATRARGTVQANNTLSHTFHQSRGSHTSPNIFSPYQSHLQLPSAGSQVQQSHERGIDEIVQVPVYLNEKPRYRLARHCRSRVFFSAENEESPGAILELEGGHSISID